MFSKALGKKTLIALAVLIATPSIMLWEGHKNTAYQDVAGIWTICSGETKGVYEGMYLSDEECEFLTSERVYEFAEDVDKLVLVDISPRTHASLILFSYNIGIGAFSRSTSLKKMNQGDVAGGCGSIKTKVFNSNGRCSGYGCGWSGGRRWEGLSNRRQYEFEMCMEGVNEG